MAASVVCGYAIPTVPEGNVEVGDADRHVDGQCKRLLSRQGCAGRRIGDLDREQ